MSLDRLRSVFANNQCPFFTGAFNLNVFGIRIGNDNPDTFSDSICVAYQDRNGWITVESYTGTTTPGIPYLREPMNPEGCLVVAPGFHPRLWAPGLHHGYPALIQVGELRYWRDPNKDSVLDPGTVQSGTGQGVNLHHAFGASRVGKNSAGCQTLRYQEHLQRFLDLVKLQRAYGFGDHVSYSLFDYTEDLEPFTVKPGELARSVAFAK